MDQQVFLGLKLKVMPFGFTNVDRQESLSKLQLWQDSACMLFNTQWYPKEESNNTSANNTYNEQVFMPSNRYFSKSTKRELSLNSLNENNSVEKKIKEIQFENVAEVDEESATSKSEKKSPAEKEVVQIKSMSEVSIVDTLVVNKKYVAHKSTQTERETEPSYYS